MSTQARVTRPKPERQFARFRGITGYSGKKLLELLLTLFVTSLVIFFSLRFMPGEPLDAILPSSARTPETIQAAMAQYGFDRPIWEQYFLWISNLLSGDFGYSYRTRSTVSNLILSHLPVTIGLILYSAVITLGSGLILGILASKYRGSAADRAITTAMIGASSIPPFVAGVILLSVFSVSLRWFPSYGAGSGFVDGIWHLTLPAVSLAITYIALVGRITRVSMISQLEQEHVEVARSRGIPDSTILRRHALRNSIGPITSVVPVVIAGLFVASAFVEFIFGLKGLGALLIQSVSASDFPVVQGIVLIIVGVFAVSSTIIDAVQPLIDPRINAGGEAR